MAHTASRFHLCGKSSKEPGGEETHHYTHHCMVVHLQFSFDGPCIKMRDRNARVEMNDRRGFTSELYPSIMYHLFHVTFSEQLPPLKEMKNRCLDRGLRWGCCSCPLAWHPIHTLVSMTRLEYRHAIARLPGVVPPVSCQR
eukprot:1155839-Pelagomonas_calceolata.AAC.22